MASVTLTSSFLGGSAITTAAIKQPSIIAHRQGVVMAEASKVAVNKSSNGRRDMIFAIAAAGACSIANIALADEPKPGTPEAKKKYAAVCVTMPTARVCRKGPN